VAQPPDISETFLREVDENLRRDQLRDFFKRYGNWLIAGVILFLALSGGFIWWKQHQVERSAEQVEQLAQSFRDIGTGNTAQVPQQVDALAENGSKGVSVTARFARAALALQTNDTKLAIGTYRSIAGDGATPAALREAALIRQTTLEFDQLPPAQVIARLEPLTKPGEPWFGSAGEMTALAMIKQGRTKEAGQMLVAIAKDKAVPEPLRGRAGQLAASIGADVGAVFQPPAQ
jgi:hypothetical protein